MGLEICEEILLLSLSEENPRYHASILSAINQSIYQLATSIQDIFGS